MITPKTPAQKLYIDRLHRPRPYIVIGVGPAGCGKTLLATTIGCQKLLRGDIKRVIVSRPTVGVDEDLGYLPGDLDEKLTPWMFPIMDALTHSLSPPQIRTFQRERKIECVPLAYMRGRTFEDSWIICDEAQNCTPNQLLMIMTRMGSNSKLVITGDPEQYDRKVYENGLSDLIGRLTYWSADPEDIQAVFFDTADVQRHPVIPAVLELYKNHESSCD